MSLLDPESRKQLKVAGRFSAIGLEIVMAMGLGFLAGRWVDARLDTQPIFTILLFAAGIFAGFRRLWQLARNTNLDQM